MKLLNYVKGMKDLQTTDARTWFQGEWLIVPQDVYDFFNYITYEVGTLMKVLHSNQVLYLADCCIKVVKQMVIHLMKIAETVVIYYDQESGWVQTQQAVSDSLHVWMND